MCPTKKLMFWALVATMCFFWNTTWAAANEETYFVATAYYSPVPNQDSYITWSYAWDVRLNGEWVTTASGNWVFPWLLAWPKNYPFGTKIYFEWYWIWTIEDRGWAIVKAWQRGQSYDRLDIWMWYWDEWLQRAIQWWRKTVKAKIVVPSAKVSLSFWESQLGYIWNLRVEPWDEWEEVRKLQEIFTKIELYNGDFDWKYESIKNELIEYQLKSWIISSADSEDAGYFGPKTVAALRETYWYSSDHLVSEPVELFSAFNHRQASEHYKIILEYWDIQVDRDTTDSEKIALFQEMMTKIWEYSWPIDWNYESVKQSLIDLQIKIWLIDNEDHWYAGNFWNRTKTALFAYYENNVWNPPNPVVRTVTKTYTLSSVEKEQISKALLIIRERLWKQEAKTGKSATEILSRLDTQITQVLPKISDVTLKAKVQFLQSIL